MPRAMAIDRHGPCSLAGPQRLVAITHSARRLTSSAGRLACGGMGTRPHLRTEPFWIDIASSATASFWPAYFSATAAKAGPTTFSPTEWQEKQPLALASSATSATSVACTGALAVAATQASALRFRAILFISGVSIVGLRKRGIAWGRQGYRSAGAQRAVLIHRVPPRQRAVPFGRLRRPAGETRRHR